MSAPASTATTASAGQGKDKAKTERKLRIAVIGVGRQGRVHADNVSVEHCSLRIAHCAALGYGAERRMYDSLPWLTPSARNRKLTIPVPCILPSFQLANTTSRAELVAVVDPSDLALRWAEANLPSSVRRFHSPEEMYGAFRVSAGAGAGADEKLGKGVKGQSGPGLDAVAIASDTDSHAPLAVQAIGMGLVSRVTLFTRCGFPSKSDVHTCTDQRTCTERACRLSFTFPFSARLGETYVTLALDTSILALLDPRDLF